MRTKFVICWKTAFKRPLLTSEVKYHLFSEMCMSRAFQNGMTLLYCIRIEVSRASWDSNFFHEFCYGWINSLRDLDTLLEESLLITKVYWQSDKMFHGFPIFSDYLDTSIIIQYASVIPLTLNEDKICNLLKNGL